MTGPLSDDPYEELPAQPRSVVREAIGLLAILVGLIVLAVVLGTVDGRLAAGLGAVVLVAAGVWLGRGDGGS